VSKRSLVYGDWMDWLLCLCVVLFFLMPTPSWHSSRYLKRHPDRKVERPIKAKDNNMPRDKVSFTTKELIFAVVLPVIAIVLAFIVTEREMFSLVYKLVVYLVCLVVIEVGVWMWERSAKWGWLLRMCVTIVVASVYGLLLLKPVQVQYGREYNLEFTDAPSLTAWTRFRINWNFAKARDYVKSLVEKMQLAELPPIDVKVFNDPNQSMPPGLPLYRGSIKLSTEELQNGRGQTHAYLFYQVTHILAPDTRQLPPWRMISTLREANDLTDYLNSALWGSPDPILEKDKSGWTGRLWAVRQRFGGAFTDRMVVYTLMSIGDTPDEDATSESDIYFCRHLRIGESVRDHDASKWKEIVSILGQEQSGLDRACDAPVVAVVSPPSPSQAPVTKTEQQKPAKKTFPPKPQANSQGASIGFLNAGKATRVFMEGNTVEDPGGHSVLFQNDSGADAQDIVARKNRVGSPAPIHVLAGTNSSVAEQLARFVDAGYKIQAGFLKDDNAQLISEKEYAWEAEIQLVLKVNLGQSFSTQFSRAISTSTTLPSGHNAQGGSICNLITAKIATLNSFINQLRGNWDD